MPYKPKSLDDINSQYDSEVSANKAIEQGKSKVKTESNDISVDFDIPTEAPSFEQTPVDSSVPDISGAVNGFIRSLNTPAQNQKPSRINNFSHPAPNQSARRPGYRPAGPAAPRTGVQGLENQRFGTQQRQQNTQNLYGERRFMGGAAAASTAGGGPNYAQQKAAAQEARKQAAEQAARKRVQDNKRAISSAGNKRADGANIDDLFSEYESIMGDQAAPDRVPRRERRHGKEKSNVSEPVVQQPVQQQSQPIDEPTYIPPSKMTGFDQFFNEVTSDIPEEERKKSAPQTKQSNFGGVFNGTDMETLPYSTKQFLYEQKAMYAEQARQVQEEYDRRRAEDYVRNETESEILRAEQHRIRIEQEERERRAEEDRIARELEAKQREEMLARQHQEELARREAEIEQLRQEKERLLAQQEAAREAEQLRLQEEARRAEELRLAEEARIAEDTKRAEELRAAEEARQAVEARRQEDARLYEEHRLAEEARHREELRAAEEQRQAEAARYRDEETRRQEAQRIYEEQRQAEQEELIRRAREEAAREAARMERERIAQEMAEQAALAKEAERAQIRDDAAFYSENAPEEEAAEDEYNQPENVVDDPSLSYAERRQMAGEAKRAAKKAVQMADFMSVPENVSDDAESEESDDAEEHLSRAERKRRAKEAKKAAKRAAKMAAYVDEAEDDYEEAEPVQQEYVADVQSDNIAEETQPEESNFIAEEIEAEPQLSRAERKRMAKEAKRAAKLAKKNRKSDDDFDDFVGYFNGEQQEDSQTEEAAPVAEEPVAQVEEPAQPDITPAPAELNIEDIFAQNAEPAEEAEPEQQENISEDIPSFVQSEDISEEVPEAEPQLSRAEKKRLAKEAKKAAKLAKKNGGAIDFAEASDDGTEEAPQVEEAEPETVAAPAEDAVEESSESAEGEVENIVSDDAEEPDEEAENAEEVKSPRKSHGFIRGFFRFILSIVMIAVILFAGVTALLGNVLHLNSGEEISLLSDYYAYTSAQNTDDGKVKYGDIVICRDQTSPAAGETFVYKTDEGYTFGTRDLTTPASVETITLDDGTVIDKDNYIGNAYFEIPYIGYAYLTIASIVNVSLNVIAIAAAVLALILLIIVVFALKNRSDRKEEKRLAKAQARAAKAMERDRAKGRIVDDGDVIASNANPEENQAEEYDEYIEPIDRENFEFEDISSSAEEAEETAEAPAPVDIAGQPVAADISQPLEVPVFEESTEESAAEADTLADDPFADISTGEEVVFSDDPFADVPQEDAGTPAEEITTDEAFEELFINDPIPASTKKSRKQKKKEKRAKKAAAAAPAPEADDDDDFDDIFDSL